MVKGDAGQQVVKDFIAQVRETTVDSDYQKWIAPLGVHLESHDDSQEDQVTIILTTPNKFVYRWVRQNFLVNLQTAAESVVNQGRKAKIELQVKGESYHKPIAERIVEASSLQYSDNRSLKKELTFDNFVEGFSNQFARATAYEVATTGKSSGNPLVFYSPSGLGKSHLLQAIANQCIQSGKKRVAYVRSEKYFREMVKSISNKSESDGFKDFYRDLDVLIIDDIHFFAGKDRTQDEFFHTFNTLFDRGRQMVFTSDRYPKVINGLEERIKSRVGMGIAVAIEPPELETRIVILQKKARNQGFHLNDDCAYFIAERIKSNVRELEGALRLVIAKANFSGLPITIELVKEALLDILAQVERNITTDTIQKQVADYYKIKLTDLLSPSKSRSVVRPRQIAMSLSKELTSKSLPEIGKDFGGKDHTTVIHAINKVKELIKKDAQLAQDYKNIERALRS